MVSSFGQTESQPTVTSAEVTRCVCTATGYTTLTICGFHQLIFKYLLMLPMLLHHQITDGDLQMDQCNLSLNSIMRKSCLGHKQVHVLKFHSFLIPEILFSNLHRAAESLQHDSSITNLNLNGTELGRLCSQILGEPMTPNCIANLNLNRTQLRRLCSLDRPFSNFR